MRFEIAVHLIDQYSRKHRQILQMLSELRNISLAEEVGGKDSENLHYQEIDLENKERNVPAGKFRFRLLIVVFITSMSSG
jgi:hypothetical protein